MEPIRVLQLMWTLITLVTTVAKGQEQHAGPPDIMMYYNYKQSQVTCVAGTNTYGNALTLITPLEYRINPVFQYKDRNGNNIEEVGCDYENRYVDQQCLPKYTNIMSSGKYLTSPVTDERWNKFDTQYTAGGNPEYSYSYAITERNFHISFSVRTWSDAQVLLCNYKGASSYYTPEKCYWILIDANKYKNETFLRKCSGKIPNDYPRGKDNPCKIARAHREVKLLNEKKWTHFTVTRENGNRILLWESTHSTPILEYTDEVPFDIDSLYIRGTSNAKAEWKIHDYQYLVVTKMKQYIKVGSQYNSPKSETLCISLYVAVCPRCAMTIIIQSDRKTEASNIIYGKQGLFIPWQLVTIEVQMHDKFIYSLYIVATAEADVTDTFWAVDDIRRCYSDEIKVASTQVQQRAVSSVSCQSLQYPEWTFTDVQSLNNSIECSDSRFTGTYCTVSCKSLLNSEYCENNMICRPTALDAPTQCTCAPNSSGPKCNTECAYGNFGYNCQNKCGKCLGGIYRCDRISGQCSSGCEEGYTVPHCIDPIGPVLLVPPTVVSVSHTSVTIRLDNITTLADSTADTFQIEYKVAGSALPWQQDTRREELAENIEATVSGLQRETTYSIRVVLYALNGDTYRLDNVPYTNATTTCEVYRMVNIEPSARHVNITLHNNEESCLVTNYFVISPDNKRQYFKQNWEQITNLKPFKTYTIIIGNYLYPEYNYTKTFTTMEDAPSAVRNLRGLRASDTTITVTWDVPYEENGNIIKYMVSTKLQKYIDCPWNAIDEIVHYTTVTPEQISDVLIPDLHPYARYKVSVIAVTVANGTENSEIFETVSSNVVSDLELPSNVTVDSYSKRVNIKWTRPICANILGPLLYNISIKCTHDPWCDQVKPVTKEVSGFNTYVSVGPLTPFTNYTLELRASRNGTISEQSITIHFTTKEGAPPEVRSLKDYSRDGYFISLRWLAPYPPHGTLEYYEVDYCYYYFRYSCSYGEKKLVYPVSCSLWDEDEYVCFDITNTAPSYKYEITVRGKNTGVTATGADKTIETKTEQSSPSVPLNLNATWNENMLILHWDCPDLPGGPLKHFLITLRQFDTEILANKGQNKQYSYRLEVDRQPLRKSYNYTINQTIPYSTSYNISVCGVNNHNGATATTDVNTPPETPVLGADIAIDSAGITNTTIPVSIPGVQANTTSSTSYVYVIVSEQKSKKIVKRDTDLAESTTKRNEILQFAPDAEDTWIAVELPSRDSNSTFIVGSSSHTHSEHLNEDLVNKPLKPSSGYDITIVLMNVYRNKRSYKDYKSPARVNTAATPVPASPSSAGLYALLLLLLVPVVLYFLYRRRMNKNPGSSSRPIINIPGWNIPRTEIQNEPDVIPLTEPSGDPVPERKAERKKPAIMPKPGQSSKIPDESTNERKISNPPTTFFHSQLVLLNNLENYVKEALANKELDKQHALFPRGQTKPWDYGIQKQNKFKNRYNNLIAYDDNRVKLQKISSDQFSDYINASYVHGYKQDKAYIATQGPKPTTVNDFWRMIWQEKVEYIVMLANVIEGGKKKCEKYWPDIDTAQKYGEIEVQFVKSDLYADFEYRLFNIKKNGQTREILQMHFTSWPDHGVPIYPQSLVPFLKKLLTLNQSTAPIVVHCSAGVGRTGTIILCDICLRMAAREGAVDALRYLHEMREQRANMVDNSDQYKLVHMVLLECLLSPDSNIPCNKDLSAAIQRLIEEGGLQMQLNYLQQSSWKDQALNFSSKKNIDPANASKNRFNDIVPVENRIYISRYPTNDEHSDYINAVPVDGFRFKEQFIVTQTPLPNTVIDFWRMIAEKEVKVIVSLNGIPVDDETCCIYWPSEQEEITSVPNVCIRYHKYQTYEHYDVHTLVIEKKIDKGKVKSLIQVVQFKGWNHEEKLPPSTEQLVTLWEETDKLSRGNYPMVVTCYNGATASGLFVAMSFVIEKVKLEQHCDPCLAVRVTRRNRKQFITDKAQLEFLYKSAVVYLSLFETYSNFEALVSK